MKTRRSARLRADWLAAWGFLLPALAALVVFRLWPFLSAAHNSFYKISPAGNLRTFVGLDNYSALLHSSQFVNSVKVTLLFSLLVNPVQILIALALAVVLVQRIPGASFLRTLIFLPVAVPPAVAALVWGLALRPDGMLNAVLQGIGLPPQPFLTSATQALPSIILIVTWSGVGYWIVFLVAGLKDIPVELAEAAVIDGATWWHYFRHVVLPLLSRTLAFVLVADTVVNFVLFAHVQVLTKGGPNGSTDLIMYQIYRQVYQYGNSGIGAAATLLLMIVVLVVVVIQFRLLREE